ncbi:MAG: hypothetical protein KatS3mg131_2619 [Candidatus Tectimicrobiota bacterium]|nr:MAG: hypothetical protein KatS3mg131_2619 [Candidatus Tectomicrobia bacterium]
MRHGDGVTNVHRLRPHQGRQADPAGGVLHVRATGRARGCESATVMRAVRQGRGARGPWWHGLHGVHVRGQHQLHDHPVDRARGCTRSWGPGAPRRWGWPPGLRALMRKHRIPQEKINVISFCGDLGGGDMGLSGISGALQTDYDLLIILYDNESAANTDIQATGLTTYGAPRRRSRRRGSKAERIMQRAVEEERGRPCWRWATPPAGTWPPPAPPTRRWTSSTRCGRP